MTHQIALSHASSVAAEAILEKLPESGIASDSLVLLDHQSNIGKRIAFGGSHLALLDQQQYDFSNCALLMMPEADPELEASVLQQGCLLVSHAIADQRAPVFIGAGGIGDSDRPSISYSETQLRLAGPELSCLLPALTTAIRCPNGAVQTDCPACFRAAEIRALRIKAVGHIIGTVPADTTVFSQQNGAELAGHDAMDIVNKLYRGQV